MRVALVIEQMDPARGGRERSVAQMARQLSRQGMEVTILCRKGSGEVPGASVEAVEVSGGRLAKLRRFARAVQERLDDFDVVHATLPIPGCDIYQLRGGSLPGQKNASLRRRGPAGKIASRIGWGLNRVRSQMARWEEQVVTSGKTLCLAVSEMVARELRDAYPCEETLRMVFNGVEAPMLSAHARSSERHGKRKILGLEAEDPLFVTAAGNFQLKGVGELLDAFARFRSKWQQQSHRPARLVVIGRNEPIRYARRAERLGLSMDVEFPGRLDEIESWLAAATATVLLSWYDPCSRVILESVACGIPAITTQYNGASEVLQDGAGIVVSAPDQTGEVARAMTRLAQPDVRAEKIAACDELADRVSMHRHVEELLSIYQEVMDRK